LLKKKVADFMRVFVPFFEAISVCNETVVAMGRVMWQKDASTKRVNKTKWQLL
jgi:hypothetical protein